LRVKLHGQNLPFADKKNFYVSKCAFVSLQKRKKMISQLIFDYHDKSYEADLSQPIDISLPLFPNGVNPTCYQAKQPESQTIRLDNFVGSVAEGGPCNYQSLSITPHGNGTHTECVGHITEQSITINQCLKNFHFVALLISVQPEIDEFGDSIITLDKVIDKLDRKLFDALIIRTLPNTHEKGFKDYSGTNPTYLDFQLAEYLRLQNIKHLLVDLPSVDKEDDGGVLRAHKLFWDYPNAIQYDASITELIFVPNSVEDGFYLLNLQIASLEMDASPSKPVLYPIKPLNHKTIIKE
jgi:kynurenine formamidase